MKNNKELFKGNVVILLSKETDVTSNKLEIQDFVEHGKPFIPVFTSEMKLSESTQGATLPFPKFGIDGLFLLSMMTGNEILRVNPNLGDEAMFIASELKEHFKTEIEQLLQTLETKSKSN